MKYSENNIAAVLRVINMHKGGIVKIADLMRHVDFEKGALRVKGTQVKSFSKGTLYGRLNNPTELTRAFDKDTFNMFVDFLDIKGLKSEIQDEEYIETQNNILPFQSDKPLMGMSGYFRTYKSSLSKPGHAISGIMHIYKNGELNVLSTYERLRYKLLCAHGAITKHYYKGTLEYIENHYVIRSTDSNTNFINQWILRPIYNSGNGLVETLEGVYSGITNKQGGTKIFCTKVFVERIHAEPGTSRWQGELRKGLGFRHPDNEDHNRRIDPDIWNILRPDIQERTLLF